MDFEAAAISVALGLGVVYANLIWNFYHRPLEKTRTAYEWPDGTLRTMPVPDPPDLQQAPVDLDGERTQHQRISALEVAVKRMEPARMDKFEADLSVFRGAIKGLTGLEKQIKSYMRKQRVKK